MKPMAPCKNCPDRCVEPNCHTTCKKYLEFVKQTSKVREAEIEFKSHYIPKNSHFN